jgi:recombination protein RecA
VKNKIAPPFKEVEIDVLFNEGISRAWEVLDIGVDKLVIKKAGAFYSYGETRLWQWRENAREFLKTNPALLLEIETAVRSA